MSRACIAILGCAALALVGATAPRTLRDGLYTADQARRGGELYAQSCARCHGAALEGSYDIPSLKGVLLAHWRGGGLDELSDYINRAMPQFAPGALPREDNAAILAFILEANGYPAGKAELPPDPGALKGVKIEAPALAAR
jgi:S-disulfanyl-L-cysteine oxidoreductase SoxD